MSDQKNDYDNVAGDYDSAQHPDSKQNSKKKSSYNSKGSRYFQVDEGYDKRVYENDWRNVLKIIGVFIIFYGFNVFYWWGLVAFGTAHPEPALWYSVAMFCFAICWIIGMLISGYKANQKLYRYEFYLERINDKEQELREKAQREAQKKAQEDKIAQNAANNNEKYNNNNNNTRKGDDYDLKVAAHEEEEQKDNLETMRDVDSDHHSHLLEDH